MTDKDTIPHKYIYALHNKKQSTRPWAYYLDENDANNCIDNSNPIYGPYIGSDSYIVIMLPFTYKEMDVCNLNRVENVYIVAEINNKGEWISIHHFLSVEKALKRYYSKLSSLSMGTTLKLLRSPIYKYANRKKAEFTTITEFNPDFTEGNRVAMDEKKLYISSFVKDLNFNLAKILTLKSILPDSGRVDYEFGTIEVTTDSPVIEFRFTLDKVEETEEEFKERCFNKMRDLLIQRTKGKL